MLRVPSSCSSGTQSWLVPAKVHACAPIYVLSSASRHLHHGVHDMPCIDSCILSVSDQGLTPDAMPAAVAGARRTAACRLARMWSTCRQPLRRCWSPVRRLLRRRKRRSPWSLPMPPIAYDQAVVSRDHRDWLTCSLVGPVQCIRQPSYRSASGKTSMAASLPGRQIRCPVRSRTLALQTQLIAAYQRRPVPHSHNKCMQDGVPQVNVRSKTNEHE